VALSDDVHAGTVGVGRDAPHLHGGVGPPRVCRAIKDSDFFANQNTAVKLTHGYTLSRVPEAFAQAGPRQG